jgi:SAM-dependent methyltransferase
MAYNYKEYWLDRGKVYLNDFEPYKYKEQEHLLLDVARKHLLGGNVKTVLEIGCGFGRITKLLVENIPSIQTYHATDISEHQLGNAVDRYFVDAPKDKVDWFNYDILTNRPSEKGQRIMLDSYDLVIASEVLMHISPGIGIRTAINNMLLISHGYVMNIDVDSRFTSRMEYYNFIHDYDSLYHEYDDDGVSECKAYQAKHTIQSIWMVTKNRQS